MKNRVARGRRSGRPESLALARSFNAQLFPGREWTRYTNPDANRIPPGYGARFKRLAGPGRKDNGATPTSEPPMLRLGDFLAHSLPPYIDILTRQIVNVRQGRFGLPAQDIEQLATAAREFLDLEADLPFPVDLALERMRWRIPYFQVEEAPHLYPSRSCFLPFPPSIVTSSTARRRLTEGDTGQRYIFACLIGHLFLEGLLPTFPFNNPNVGWKDPAEDARCYFAGALLIPKSAAIEYAGREEELAQLCKTSVRCAQTRQRRMTDE